MSWLHAFFFVFCEWSCCSYTALLRASFCFYGSKDNFAWDSVSGWLQWWPLVLAHNPIFSSGSLGSMSERKPNHQRGCESKRALEQVWNILSAKRQLQHLSCSLQTQTRPISPLPLSPTTWLCPSAGWGVPFPLWIRGQWTSSSLNGPPNGVF